MCNRDDIVLSVDYHEQNFVARWCDARTGEERVLRRKTTRNEILRLVDDAGAQARRRGGRAVWLMESTTGWARVKDLLAGKVRFIVTNVLQMPRGPKAHRRKTDKTDTKRQLREHFNGTLPEAYQPPIALRRLRRLVAARESLVSRRTAVRNWIDRYLAHETWVSRRGLWSDRGMQGLAVLAGSLAEPDRTVLSTKLAELGHLAELLGPVEAKIVDVYRQWREAQWLDEIYGIAEIAAVSILARIGDVRRFASAEELIAFAGLAPGIHESDATRHDRGIGGGGTDKRLRHYLIEATIWARRIPRYRKTYERAKGKRGNKVARLVVARLLLRSIYKMLRDEVRFDRLPAAEKKKQKKQVVQ